MCVCVSVRVVCVSACMCRRVCVWGEGWGVAWVYVCEVSFVWACVRL